MNKQLLRNFRALWLSLIFITSLAVIIFCLKQVGYHFSYCVTNSMPKGLYLIVPETNFNYQEIVEFSPPPHIIVFAKNLHWLPSSNNLLKYVAARAGDHVCVRDHGIWVNQKLIGRVYDCYQGKKPLPQTAICSKLKQDEYLLLSTKQDRSFDGRYFGITTHKQIKGKAIPIWVSEH